MTGNIARIIKKKITRGTTLDQDETLHMEPLFGNRYYKDIFKTRIIL